MGGGGTAQGGVSGYCLLAVWGSAPTIILRRRASKPKEGTERQAELGGTGKSGGEHLRPGRRSGIGRKRTPAPEPLD